MNKARSIKQNARSDAWPDALPNFRNLGVTLRILLLGNGLALLQSVLMANGWVDVSQRMMQIYALFMPILLASLLSLWIMHPWLQRQSYRFGVLTMTGLVAVLTLAIYLFGGELYRPLGGAGQYFDEVRYVLLSMMVCAIMLMYFRLRARVLSRALHEARLQVLRARIRPHFLFNTINAVLGIVRAQPKSAENALEDMADLFRMAMSDAQDLVPLAQEIKLAKQYLALEKLRMGERLRVDWQVQDILGDALIPPLLLQPLLENAVYHGIEPLAYGGCISIVMSRSKDEMRLSVENPCVLCDEEMSHEGNSMALQNIRERLELLFDVEARYRVERGKGFYRVEIAMPHMKERLA